MEFFFGYSISEFIDDNKFHLKIKKRYRDFKTLHKVENSVNELGITLQGDEDLFKNDPFKSDLPADGETSGARNGK